MINLFVICFVLYSWSNSQKAGLFLSKQRSLGSLGTVHPWLREYRQVRSGSVNVQHVLQTMSLPIGMLYHSAPKKNALLISTQSCHVGNSIAFQLSDKWGFTVGCQYQDATLACQFGWIMTGKTNTSQTWCLPGYWGKIIAVLLLMLAVGMFLFQARNVTVS